MFQRKKKDNTSDSKLKTKQKKKQTRERVWVIPNPFWFHLWVDGMHGRLCTILCLPPYHLPHAAPLASPIPFTRGLVCVKCVFWTCAPPRINSLLTCIPLPRPHNTSQIVHCLSSTLPSQLCVAPQIGAEEEYWNEKARAATLLHPTCFSIHRWRHSKLQPESFPTLLGSREKQDKWDNNLDECISTFHLLTVCLHGFLWLVDLSFVCFVCFILCLSVYGLFLQFWSFDSCQCLTG